MGLDFHDWRDRIALFVAILLIVSGVLVYLDVTVPALTMIVGALFIVGGVFGLLDAFSVWSKPLLTAYVALFIVVIAMGVTAFVTIPYLSPLLEIAPAALSITNYIVKGVVAIGLIAVAISSD